MKPTKRLPQRGRNASTPDADADVRPPEERTYAVDWAHQEGAVDELMDELATRAKRRGRRRAAVAASAAAIFTIASLLWHFPIQQDASVPSPASAIVAMPSRQSLADGSVVELKDGAEIAVEFTAAFRRVTLQEGEAHFQVVKDLHRPFVVKIGQIEVRAVGTAFLVHVDRTSAEVLVTEGTVAVGAETEDAETRGRGNARAEDAETRGRGDVGNADRFASFPTQPLTPLLVSAGNRVVIDVSSAGAPPSGVEAVPAPEIAERLAWRVPRFEFSGTPLAEAIEMFNRHNEEQLVLADRSLGKLKVSGFLRADKTQTFLLLLESDFGLTADRRGSSEVILRRAQ